MSNLEILHEYRPGEYCEAVQCPRYNEGDFDDRCSKCKAFIYYQWLRDNSYRLLVVAARLPGDLGSVQELVEGYSRRWEAEGTWFRPTVLEALTWMATEVGEALDVALRQDPKWFRNNPRREPPTDEELAEEIADAIMMGCVALSNLEVSLYGVVQGKLSRMDERRTRD
jgi:NTP pyrophosphatase (non-canonical NTP hydrolase)